MDALAVNAAELPVPHVLMIVLQVLDYTLPEHAAILKAQMPDMDDDDSAPAEQLPAQAGVKPEAGQQQAAPSGCIDLAADAAPLPKVKKQKV